MAPYTGGAGATCRRVLCVVALLRSRDASAFSCRHRSAGEAAGKDGNVVGREEWAGPRWPGVADLERSERKWPNALCAQPEREKENAGGTTHSYAVPAAVRREPRRIVKDVHFTMNPLSPDETMGSSPIMLQTRFTRTTRSGVVRKSLTLPSITLI